jgi:hypothetical protein
MKTMNGWDIHTFSLIALTIIFLILLITVLVLNSRLRTLAKKYDLFMDGGDGQSVERKLAIEIKELRAIAENMDALQENQEEILQIQNQCTQKIGFVKYNAFDNIGNNLSFALTLLDGENNGICISSVYGRNESRVFAKPILAGKCAYSMSAEEQESLQDALNSLSNTEVLKTVKTA